MHWIALNYAVNLNSAEKQDLRTCDVTYLLLVLISCVFKAISFCLWCVSACVLLAELLLFIVLRVCYCNEWHMFSHSGDTVPGQSVNCFHSYCKLSLAISCCTWRHVTFYILFSSNFSPGRHPLAVSYTCLFSSFTCRGYFPYSISAMYNKCTLTPQQYSLQCGGPCFAAWFSLSFTIVTCL